jgi:hypothetical protein
MIFHRIATPVKAIGTHRADSQNGGPNHAAIAENGSLELGLGD